MTAAISGKRWIAGPPQQRLASRLWGTSMSVAPGSNFNTSRGASYTPTPRPKWQGSWKFTSNRPCLKDRFVRSNCVRYSDICFTFSGSNCLSIIVQVGQGVTIVSNSLSSFRALRAIVLADSSSPASLRGYPQQTTSDAFITSIFTVEKICIAASIISGRNFFVVQPG